MKKLTTLIIASLLSSCGIPISIKGPDGSISYDSKSGILISPNFSVIVEK